MWNESKPGLIKKKPKQNWIYGLLETYRVSSGIRKQPVMPVSRRFYFKPCAMGLHPHPGALGRSAIRMLKMQRHTSSQATYPVTSTKSQSFLSTWPLAFPCTVLWNTQFKLLFTKLKTQSKMSWRWLCVFFPQELVGHFRKQRSSFHRGKLIHIKTMILDFASTLQVVLL